VFDRASPKRRISALELLGTILLAKFCAKRLGSRALGVTLTAKTDNQGNSFALAKKSAKAWPNSALLMELTAQEIHTGSKCDTSHVKRNSNIWSDDLTNNKFSNFNAELKDSVLFKDLKFYIFDTLRELEAEDHTKASQQPPPSGLVAPGTFSPGRQSG